jgi:uncharacterized protein (DUF58 family)
VAVRLKWILGACLAGLAAAALLDSAPLVFAALAGAVIAVLVTLTRRRLFSGVTFDRRVSRRVVAWGGELEVTVTVANDKLLPLVWMRVRDMWPEGLEPVGFALRRMAVMGRQELVQTVSVRWYERLRRRYRVRCVVRGTHRLGPVELEAGDPFGIAGVSRKLEAPARFTVLPKVLDIPVFPLLTGRPMVDEAALRSLAVDPAALRGMRSYRHGDPLRAVNWRATARTRRLHTNEFDPTSIAAVRLLLDVGSRHRAWEAVDDGRMELLCVVGASLATAFANNGYAVGLAANASMAQELHAVDLQPVHGALPDVLEAIACLRPVIVRDYGSMVSAEADELSDADCVLVTAGLAPGVRGPLARLRAERATTVVCVGVPDAAEARDVDLVVPGDFDWRTAHALALRA